MGGPTYSRKGPHLAVRVRDEEYPWGRVDRRACNSCLYCGMVRQSDHLGTIWIEQSDARNLHNEGSQNEQSRAVATTAMPNAPPEKKIARSEST